MLACLSAAVGGVTTTNLIVAALLMNYAHLVLGTFTYCFRLRIAVVTISAGTLL